MGHKGLAKRGLSEPLDDKQVKRICQYALRLDDLLDCVNGLVADDDSDLARKIKIKLAHSRKRGER